MTPAGEPAAAPDLAAKPRSPDYLKLLAFTAALGVPISAAAYWLLDLISHLQHWIFDASELPQWLGFEGVPLWWPLLPLALAGLLVGLTIRHMPGGGGHSPADGFKPGGTPSPIELPSVVLAAVATLALGAVLGPEAPLIAIGGGLGVCAVRLAQRNAPAQTAAIVAAAGSFAAISALLGSPILGAFLLMEASGLGGVTLDLVLVPGLLSAGLGYLVFVGLDAWTGHGTFSLAIPNLPPISRPTGSELLWAPVIGIIAAVLGLLIRRSALSLRSQVAKRIVVLTTVAGVAIAGAAILYGQVTGHASTDVLFDGQSALPALLQNNSSFTVGALLMLVVCKGAAYSISLSSLRGGPTFPGMYIGAAGGLAMSHLLGLR